jgi:uncharacterized membrane protein HdeD (DUF308 family)
MSESTKLAPGLLDGIRKNARIAVFAGITMVICGLLAVGSPLVAGVYVTVFVGILLAIGGISQCILAFQAGAFGRGLLMFIMGALTTIVGFYLFNQPLAGLAAITLILAAYFVAVGVVELIAALQIRPEPGWGLLLSNGIVTFLLGAIIWRQYPVSGAWAVGVLFGIKLLFSGIFLIAVGRSVRSAAGEVKSEQ